MTRTLLSSAANSADASIKMLSPDTQVDTEATGQTAVAGATAAVEDRRRSPRSQRLAPAWLSTSNKAHAGSGIHATLRDLSLHGAGLNSPVPLRVGDAHWMVVADKQLRLSTRMRVVTCRPREDGTYIIGGEFF